MRNRPGLPPPSLSRAMLLRLTIRHHNHRCPSPALSLPTPTPKLIMPTRPRSRFFTTRITLIFTSRIGMKRSTMKRIEHKIIIRAKPIATKTSIVNRITIAIRIITPTTRLTCSRLAFRSKHLSVSLTWATHSLLPPSRQPALCSQAKATAISWRAMSSSPTPPSSPRSTGMTPNRRSPQPSLCIHMPV